jgi:hypothetical protein
MNLESLGVLRKSILRSDLSCIAYRTPMLAAPHSRSRSTTSPFPESGEALAVALAPALSTSFSYGRFIANPAKTLTPAIPTSGDSRLLCPFNTHESVGINELLRRRQPNDSAALTSEALENNSRSKPSGPPNIAARLHMATQFGTVEMR